MRPSPAQQASRNVAWKHQANLLLCSKIPLPSFGTGYGRAMQSGKPQSLAQWQSHARKATVREKRHSSRIRRSCERLIRFSVSIPVSVVVSVGFSFPFATVLGAAGINTHGIRMNTSCFRYDDLLMHCNAKWAGGFREPLTGPSGAAAETRLLVPL
jgi:hypothetical protein